VVYASHSLTEAEKQYVQIEKEALAVTWACEKFANHILGCRVEIETDHKSPSSAPSIWTTYRHGSSAFD